jgi:exopolysaccharide production protein ExoQ
MPHAEPRLYRSLTLSYETYALLLALAVALTFGGGSTGLGLPVLFLAITTLAMLVLNARGNAPRIKLTLAERCLVYMIIALPLLQLIPLPSALWSQLPGRDLELAARDMLGVANAAFPISVSPADTAALLVPLVCAAAIGHAALNANSAAQRAISTLIVAFAFVNVAIGSVQVMSGGQYLNFHNSGHAANAIGMLANRNHTALYLACSIPLFNQLLFSSNRLHNVNAKLVLALAGTAFLLTGIIGTTSRAGLIFGLLASIITILLAMPKRIFGSRGRAGIIFIIGSMLLFALLLTSDRTEFVWDRFSGSATDLRWTIWENSLTTATHFWPIGAGFGTFVDVYARFEPLADVSPQFVNNAHNDYIEVAMEAGLAGIACILAAVVWLIQNSWQILRLSVHRTLESPAIPLMVFPWFAALHSMVDYPIRRLAIAIPVVVAMALLRQHAQRQLYQDDKTRQT